MSYWGRGTGAIARRHKIPNPIVYRLSAGPRSPSGEQGALRSLKTDFECVLQEVTAMESVPNMGKEVDLA